MSEALEGVRQGLEIPGGLALVRAKLEQCGSTEERLVVGLQMASFSRDALGQIAMEIRQKARRGEWGPAKAKLAEAFGVSVRLVERHALEAAEAAGVTLPGAKVRSSPKRRTTTDGGKEGTMRESRTTARRQALNAEVLADQLAAAEEQVHDQEEELIACRARIVELEREQVVDERVADLERQLAELRAAANKRIADRDKRIVELEAWQGGNCSNCRKVLAGEKGDPF